MLSVTLPIWLIIAAAGLPAMLFLLAGIMLVRLKRRSRRQHGNRMEPHMISTPDQFNNQVYKQLVEQQIDAVFDTLITVIESERIKLKALVGHPTLSTGAKPFAAPAMSPSPAESLLDAAMAVNEKPASASHAIEPAGVSEEPTLGQSIVAMSKKGMTAEQIALQLGLSQSEMSLAVKMNNSRKSTVGRKMQAMA